MGTNGINEALSAGFKVKLENRGAKSSGITFELKSVFDEMAKQGLIKDTDGKGLTKQDALNLYEKLNKIHKETNRATNYTTMQVGQEFDYTADEMKALAKAAGYEVVEQPLTEAPPTAPETPSEPETPSDDKIVTPQQEEPVVTGPDDPEYEKARLSLVEEDFSANGQVGKIVGNQYYINGKEVTKEVYENAKTKALASQVPTDETNPLEEGNVQELSRKEIRQAKRAKHKEARQENRLNRRLEKADAVFEFEGQVGKILDGKFYINNKEVSQNTFEVAKLKAAANEKIENIEESIKDNTAARQRTMTDEQLAEYLKNDVSYQEHKKTLQDADKLMREIETKYNFERGDMFGDLRLAKADEEAFAAYKEAKSIYNTYTEGLSDYEQEMANWVDGSAEKSIIEINGRRWTNIERITLSNGQRAWKTDQGVFYPGPDGMLSYNKVPEEYLE